MGFYGFLSLDWCKCSSGRGMIQCLQCFLFSILCSFMMDGLCHFVFLFFFEATNQPPAAEDSHLSLYIGVERFRILEGARFRYWGPEGGGQFLAGT